MRVFPWPLHTAKGQMLAIFVVLLLIAVPSAGGTALLPNLLAAIVPGCLIDGMWMSLRARRVRIPTSALLSGMFVFSILSISESWMVVAWTSSFAVLSKLIVRGDREHFFNPAALALLWAPIAFGSGESWWGALGDLSWWWIVVLLALGAFLSDRLNKFPLVLSFLATYFAFFAIAAVSYPAGVAEMFREPFLQAALFLAFFMLTDPPTSPNRYVDQVWFGVLAALAAGAAQLIGAGQTYLLIGVLVANAVLTVVRSIRRRVEVVMASAITFGRGPKPSLEREAEQSLFLSLQRDELVTVQTFAAGLQGIPGSNVTTVVTLILKENQNFQ